MEYDDEEPSTSFKPEDQFEYTENIDFESQDFLSLPSEIKQELLTNARTRSRIVSRDVLPEV